MKKQSYSVVSKIAVVGALFAPLFAFAAYTPNTSACSSVASAGLVGLFNCAGGLIDTLVWLLWALALMLFLWGVTKFITKADDEKQRIEGRNFMIWGIIALFVMTSAMALAGVISRTFGFSTGTPQLNSYNSPTGTDFANSRGNLVPSGSNQAVY